MNEFQSAALHADQQVYKRFNSGCFAYSLSADIGCIQEQKFRLNKSKTGFENRAKIQNWSRNHSLMKKYAFFEPIDDK